MKLARAELARYAGSPACPIRTTPIASPRPAAGWPWSHRRSSGSRRRARPSTCPTSSRTRLPTSGGTRRWATTSPSTPSPTRPWPTTSRARRTSRSARAAARPIGSTARSQAYSDLCYFEVIYVQGARFLDKLRKDYGSGRFKAAIRAYTRDNRFDDRQQRAPARGLPREDGRRRPAALSQPLPQHLLAARPRVDAAASTLRPHDARAYRDICLKQTRRIAARDPDGTPTHRGWNPLAARRRWVEPFVLAMLARGDTYGYAILGRLEEMRISNGPLDVGPGLSHPARPRALPGWSARLGGGVGRTAPSRVRADRGRLRRARRLGRGHARASAPHRRVQRRLPRGGHRPAAPGRGPPRARAAPPPRARGPDQVRLLGRREVVLQHPQVLLLLGQVHLQQGVEAVEHPAQPDRARPARARRPRWPRRTYRGARRGP